MESLRSTSLKKVLNCFSETDKDEILKQIFPKNFWLVKFISRNSCPDRQIIVRATENDFQNFWKSELFRKTIMKYGFILTFKNIYNEYFCLICDNQFDVNACEHFGKQYKDYNENDWKIIFDSITIIQRTGLFLPLQLKWEKLPDQYHSYETIS